VCLMKLTDAQREEMRCYRHRAGMLDSKLRATARHKKFLQLQMTVQEINVSMFCDEFRYSSAVFWLLCDKHSCCWKDPDYL